MTTDNSDISNSGAELNDAPALDYRARPGFLKTKFYWLILLVLLGVAGYWRFWGFFLPSSIGDSPTYQGLAMKMNAGYLQDYTIFRYRIAPRGETGLVDYLYEPDPAQWNSRRIRPIYHRPLHLQPPMLSTLIWLSHGVFRHGEAYTSVGENLGSAVTQNPPWDYFREQFYALLIPYLASMGSLLLTFFFCKKYYGPWTGLLAVLILIGSPVDIAVGAKLFADGPLSFFCLLSLYLFFSALDPGVHPWRRALGAGVALGCAFLTKTTGVLFGFGMLLAVLLKPKSGIGLLWKRQIGQLLLAGLATFLVALPWNLLMLHHYGSAFVNTPPDPGNSWYAMVFGRPLKAYFLDLIYFLPPLAVGWLFGFGALLAPRRAWRELVLFLQAAFYLSMFMLFVRTGTAGVEDRYLLPIYPLLAILAARAITWLLERFQNLFRTAWLSAALYSGCFLLLAYYAWRAAPIGLSSSFRGLAVFKPLGY